VSDRVTRRAIAIERALAARGHAERRAFLTGGYSPTALRCFGVTVPDMRAVMRDHARQLKAVHPREVLDLALALADRRTMEGRQVGYELLARRRDALALVHGRTLARLGAGNDNWASVDGFATCLVGPAWRTGRVRDAAALRWARSRDRWWRRTALAASVALNVAARGGAGDTRRTLLVCEPNAGTRDPMLAKALSWALRSLVPHDPGAVRAFLDRHRARVPAIVRREVSTKLRTGRKAVKAAPTA
jgi:3-methyladenine DNA glycosylase AlkD